VQRLAQRILLCSPVIPPHDSGAAVVIGRMFRDIDPDDYCVVSFGPAAGEDGPGDPALPARTHRPPGFGWRPPGPHSDYPLIDVRETRRFMVEAGRRADVLATIARDERCRALLVTSGGTPDLLAAAIAARRTRLPLIVWMFDHWRYQLQWHRGLRHTARMMQSVVMRSAAAIMVPNEGLRGELRQAHGRHAVVVGNPRHQTATAADAQAIDWPDGPDERRIVYTGQVYGAQLDAIARLVDALESPRLQSWRLHVYSAQAGDFIRPWLSTGRLVLHPHLGASEIREVQRHADILFLPLAFASPYPAIIRTSAPTKLGEYLTSGRPILVHAPPDSYLSGIARLDGFGEVVDALAPERLAEAILRISDEPARRSEMVANARTAAARYYAPGATTERFREVLDGVLRDPE